MHITLKYRYYVTQCTLLLSIISSRQSGYFLIIQEFYSRSSPKTHTVTLIRTASLGQLKRGHEICVYETGTEFSAELSRYLPLNCKV